MPEFVNRYLFELSPNILFRNVPCYNVSEKTELFDLARPAGDLVTRTAEIDFMLRGDPLDDPSRSPGEPAADPGAAPEIAPAETADDAAVA